MIYKISFFSLFMRKMGDKGQMKLSFGMIFSIILIIIFVAFAGYAIVKLLDFQCSATSGQFLNAFGEDIDKIWKGGVGSQEVSYRVPKKIKKICFIDYNSPEKGGIDDMELYDELRQGFDGEENLFFYPLGSSCIRVGFELNHIDLVKITGEDNPRCFETSGGEINFVIKMDSGESLVNIEDA
jgi:hypothetical protein